jgi:SHQ1 protein
LTYPLYRNYSLAEKIWKETVRYLAGGKRPIIRLLMAARIIFNDGGDWSLYSRIIWEDYIIWAQGCKERVLKVLAEEMQKMNVDVADIGFGLEDL